MLENGIVGQVKRNIQLNPSQLGEQLFLTTLEVQLIAKPNYGH